MSVIVTGDDVTLPVSLKKDNTAFSINTAAVVKAALISEDRARTLINPVVCASTTVGADWANSLVVVVFSSADTALITEYGSALLEIQVNDNGKTTWFVTLSIEKGTIS